MGICEKSDLCPTVRLYSFNWDCEFKLPAKATPKKVPRQWRPKSTILRPFEAQWRGYHAGGGIRRRQAFLRHVETIIWPFWRWKKGRRGKKLPDFSLIPPLDSSREALSNANNQQFWRNYRRQSRYARQYCYSDDKDNDDILIPRQGASFDVTHNIIHNNTVSASLDVKKV